MPPIDVVIKKVLVILPVSLNCFSAYRVSVGKMTAIHKPALIEDVHKITSDPGTRIAREKLAAAPVIATFRMRDDGQRREKTPTKIRPIANAPQKREFSRRAAVSERG